MIASAPETQIGRLVAKYSPTVAAQLREARNKLRAHFPHGFELVFDNYNALVFAISPTEKTSEAFISVAGYPRGATRFFLRGANRGDPQGRPEGGGNQGHRIRLAPPANITHPAVAALIRQ